LFPSLLAHKRYCEGLDENRVNTIYPAVGAVLLAKTILKSQKNNINHYIDGQMGQAARLAALRQHASLFMYSYYASQAFHPDYERPDLRFYYALQAHPASLKAILMEEMERTPFAKASLESTYEFSLDKHDFDIFCQEPLWANGWVVASSFTGSTLIEHGVPAEAIHIVPYGVTHENFSIRPQAPAKDQPFTIIYVGNINQLKGVTYLLDAMRLLKTNNIRLVICTRFITYPELLEPYADLHIDIKTGLSGAMLAEAIHRADVFVFPSLGDGFGHVILEAMACGVPVIASTNSCGPDVIVEGEDGFVVPIRSAQAIAEKLAWGIDHRSELAIMGEKAAVQASHFTWQKYRQDIINAYRSMVDIASRQHQKS
jgi:glycosyltransferase involved in cell wall biosynthesis